MAESKVDITKLVVFFPTNKYLKKEIKKTTHSQQWQNGKYPGKIIQEG